MFNVLKSLLENGNFTVEESFSIPSREASYRAIPKYLFNSRVGLQLHKSAAGERGLWNHQAVALEKIGEGKNVVISTGTASGKSLIFRSASFHQILLNPDSRVLVFYPLKALATDQLRGWQAMAQSLELPPEAIGRIDGSIAGDARDNILSSARVVIMTPDVCHAWMMSRLSIPVVKEFLKRVTHLVMDEAHTLEGVFGSNFAYLLRRLYSARRLLLADDGGKREMQIIAATATIANPTDHMNILTGMAFESVDSTDDGSPHAERYCAHISCPLGEEMRVARIIQTELLTQSKEGGFITFVDSRKGVEVLARSSQAAVEELCGDDAVMPYRAGYDSVDREKIEKRLQAGTLRGVISTSALELGIDLPHLTVGMNIGVPSTRKAYRQRVGRVGRLNRGAFLIVAPPNAFKGYGTTFREYHDLSVEPSYLYLDNRFMQFAQSRCLVDELEALGAGSTFPTANHWPEGFRDIYATAKPGGARPPEFDAIAQLGGDAPQRSYPLRNIGELNLKIARGESEPFGEVNESQALRECYPGATYLHMGRAFEVMSWNTSTFQPFVKVKPGNPGRNTKPRIKTWINTGVMPPDVLEGHFLVGEGGFMAECQMQITEKVEGYIDQAGDYFSYQELRQRNPNMRPRQRNFRTSGVILCIQEEWFKRSGVKQRIADWILAIFCREYSMLSQDVGVAATNISVRSKEGASGRGDCLVLFDQVYGSLRLTERLYLNFRLILDRMLVSAESSEEAEKAELIDYVNKLDAIYSRLDVCRNWGEALPNDAPNECIQAFTPGSVVCLREAGKIGTDVEVIQPTWINGQLMYQVKAASRQALSPAVKRWVAAQAVEPSADADAWQYGWWNAETQEYVDDDLSVCEIM